MSNIEDSPEDLDTLRNEDLAVSETSDNLINVLLDGRYLIEQKLGQGGFGSVYLGSDNKLVPRKIVIKVMHLRETTNDWSRRKFRQEFEALARINHPSVVGVLDGGETTDGRPYIVMQYIDGVSLRALMESTGMPLWRVANIVKQVGKALSAAHHVGITHRDLKPENIMVQVNEDEEYVKVIDFGVAKVKNSIIDVTTAKDIAVGTIAYMSPEQLSAHPVTPESDVYSLGVIAYEMITGQRPLNPESAFQLLELQRSGPSEKPSALRAGVSKEAEEILFKALSFNPEDRYQRARDFGDLLSSALLEDDEQTKIATRIVKKVDTSTIPETPSLETAHVLFVDIVGYSRLLIDDQKQQLIKLQQLVSGTDECKRAKSSHELIALPTGDGMALVFFNDPEAPVKCAVELSQALNSAPEIKLRMGVHSGLVYRMADIKNNLNVAGGGINIAQRVMDCGDSGHILLSKRVADDLGQLARWSPHLQNLGDAEVKHGVMVHVFNLAGDDFGNRDLPTKFQKTTTTRKPASRLPMIAAAVVLLLAVVITAVYFITKTPASASSNSNATTVTTTPPTPNRSITYWFNYQRTKNDSPDGEVRKSAGYIAFGSGWRFQFNVMSAEAGSLYLVNAAPTKTGGTEYNILFPIAALGQTSANIPANQTFSSPWARFVDQTGVEEIWIIWSTQPIAELDSIFTNASNDKTNPGVVTNPDEVATLKKYLVRSRDSLAPERDKEKTTLRGRSNVMVELVELSHESN